MSLQQRYDVLAMANAFEAAKHGELLK